MPPSKDKGKGKALARNTSSSDLRRRALDRAISRHYDKKKRRAERRSLLDDSNPLDALYSIDEASTDDDANDDDNNDNNDTGNISAPHRSEAEWDAIRRSNEAMSEELAHLRAMIARDNQLANGATPGASGSRSRHDAPRSNDPPVALGQPALNNPPAPVARPPRSTPEERPRRFVAIPPSKTKTHLKDIREYAGLTENAQRWLEICNIIRDLMTRVGMDYANSWLHQDKTKLGILYSLILKEVPELSIFQNGWATEWLVQNKFNNHRFYLGNKKRRYSHIKEEGDEEGHRLPPSPLPQALSKPKDDEEGHGLPPPPEFSPPSEPSLPPEPSPPPEPLPQPEALPPLPRAIAQPPATQELNSPPDLPSAPHPRSPAHSPPPSRTSRPRPQQGQGGPGTRYNTRARATALASAVAQTTAATKQSDQQDKATKRTTRRKNQRHRSESPLRPLDESDDGGRLTEEEDA